MTTDPLMMCPACNWIGPRSQALTHAWRRDRFGCPECAEVVAPVPAALADAWRVREAVVARMAEMQRDADDLGMWGPEEDTYDELAAILHPEEEKADAR